MTKTQFKRKFKELLTTNNKEMLRLADHYWNSGALDKSSYDDDFVLPKIVMTACCERMVHQWMPFSSEYRDIVANLKHF